MTNDFNADYQDLYWRGFNDCAAGKRLRDDHPAYVAGYWAAAADTPGMTGQDIYEECW